MKVFWDKCAVMRRHPLDDDLMRLARALQRLSPSHRNPEKYHEDKSQIIDELKRLAREVRGVTAHHRRRTSNDGAHAPSPAGPSRDFPRAGNSDPAILFDDRNK